MCDSYVRADALATQMSQTPVPSTRPDYSSNLCPPHTFAFGMLYVKGDLHKQCPQNIKECHMTLTLAGPN